MKEARKALRMALANSSGFRVGAALEAEGGKVYRGGNIETITSKLGICAERVALVKALSEGKRKFKSIAIVSSSGAACPPCGVCRQLLWEFAPDLRVILADHRKSPVIREIKALLPLPFDRSKLDRKHR